MASSPCYSAQHRIRAAVVASRFESSRLDQLHADIRQHRSLSGW